MDDESDFPVRMFIYHYRIFDKYNRREVVKLLAGPCRRQPCLGVPRATPTEKRMPFIDTFEEIGMGTGPGGCLYQGD